MDQVLVNLQVGWEASAQGNDFENLRLTASSTGLKWYLDARSMLLDARHSAEALRRLSDEGVAQLSLDEEGAVAAG